MIDGVVGAKGTSRRRDLADASKTSAMLGCYLARRRRKVTHDVVYGQVVPLDESPCMAARVFATGRKIWPIPPRFGLYNIAPSLNGQAESEQTGSYQ